MRFRKLLALCSLVVLGILGCGNVGKAESSFVTISPQEAKRIIDTDTGYVIVDVRNQDEFDAVHIPGAILLPLPEIGAKAEQLLKDKKQLILVHCRSGVRSKKAAQILVDLGYTNIKDFGGIIDWPYDVVKG